MRGAVTGGTLHLHTEQRAVKARNNAVSSQALVHLESGTDVLIVHGLAEDLGPPSAVPHAVAALAANYTRPAPRAPSADSASMVIGCAARAASRSPSSEFRELQRLHKGAACDGFLAGFKCTLAAGKDREPKTRSAGEK